MAFRSRRVTEKPIIGVTGNARVWSPSWWHIRLSLFLVGARAERISVRHPVSWMRLDGLIISGGDDIHPSLYGEEPMHKASYDPQRDSLEELHIRKAMQENLPMLGICRGYQLMNVVAGGHLHSDIRAMRSATSNRGTVLARKTAEVTHSGLLFQCMKRRRLRINSLHHQAVKRPGKGFQVVATDLDGFTQAVEHENPSWLGVQWHPEYLWYRREHLALFRWLVRLARTRRATQAIR